jgi:hypothetical protein
LKKGRRISDPHYWQDFAIVIAEHYGELSAKARDLDVVTMLQKCSDQQLKARIVEERGQATKDGFKELEKFREGLVTGLEP